jgi:uncharacterized RDD family membrane protein YckC
MNPIRLGISAVLLLVGVLWIGQGTGMLGSSAMSGQSVWALIGAVLVVVAAGLAWSARGTNRG